MDAIAHWLKLRHSLPTYKVQLGGAISNAYVTDPKMIGFICARYKFVAKMLAGRDEVLEVGCGDAFGAPIVAAEVDHLVCSDIDSDTLVTNQQRCLHPNIDFSVWNEQPLCSEFSAAYAIDVIEHVPESDECDFMRDIVLALRPEEGTLLLGTPNATAHEHASPVSRAGHINLKTHDQLRELGQRFCLAKTTK
jgi:2-polyprenyl-3-methyl-5-hydroxy-6-metoxy-1,4-benzoquinol methylase